ALLSRGVRSDIVDLLVRPLVVRAAPAQPRQPRLPLVLVAEPDPRVLACGVDGYARVCRLGHRERFDVIDANAAELELVAVGVVEGQKHARAPRRRVPRVSGRLERDAGGERGANLSQG